MEHFLHCGFAAFSWRWYFNIKLMCQISIFIKEHGAKRESSNTIIFNPSNLKFSPLMHSTCWPESCKRRCSEQSSGFIWLVQNKYHIMQAPTFLFLSQRLQRTADRAEHNYMNTQVFKCATFKKKKKSGCSSNCTYFLKCITHSVTEHKTWRTLLLPVMVFHKLADA